MGRYVPEHFSKEAFSKYRLNEIVDAENNGKILEGEVVRCNGKSLELGIDLGTNMSGHINIDDFEYTMGDKTLKKTQIFDKVGKTVQFKVVSHTTENGHTDVTLSRRLAQKECYDNYIVNLKPGDIINARSIGVQTYGLFCDIGCGIVALLHIDDLCTTHIANPKQQLSGIKNIKVVVKENDDGKITLSHKELLGTWEEEAANYSEGDVVVGIVEKVEKYGAFIQLTPNLVGLTSETSGLKSGDIVSVCIQSIIPEKMKIKLSVMNVTSRNSGEITRFKYCLPESNKIDHWIYSPEKSEKIIETFFGNKAS